MNRLRVWSPSALGALAVSCAALSVLGCGSGLSTSSSKLPAPVSSSITGRVHGGQQPISGAVIQLYAVGITGARSASTPLVTKTVTTDAYGYFNISGDWDCTSNTAAYGVNPLLYIVASGGNPGISGNTNNAAINLVAALGPCSNIGSSTTISLDELTTVAATYALAPFMADAAHVGAAGAKPIGLVNAFNTASLLVNWSSGLAPGNLLPASATAPVAELNSLADLLSACVNTTGTDGTCSTLFTTATPTNGTAPTDIVGVILNLASNPACNAAQLFSLIQPTPPFQPVLTAAPSDWTIALNFTGGGLNAPVSLALDASGNVWIANAAGNSVSEISPVGAQLTGPLGYIGNGNILGAQGIAIDKAGSVWIADTLLSSVVELSVANGSIQSSSTYTAGGISGPIGIAIDSQNDVWIANFTGASVTELNSSGSPMGSSPLTANAQLQAPIGIAIDGAGNAWVTDNLGSDVLEFGTNQSLLSANGFTDGAILAPQGIAVDANGRAWVAYQGTNAAAYYTNTLNNIGSSNPYSGLGLSMPTAIAIDGQGTAWVTNNVAVGSLAKLSPAQNASGSVTTSFGSLSFPLGIAIDASGSIWTANTGDNSVSEFVGLASATAMPLAVTAGP